MSRSDEVDIMLIIRMSEILPGLKILREVNSLTVETSGQNCVETERLTHTCE